MDVEISILNEINQVEKDKYYMVSLKCVKQKKNNSYELVYKTETDSLTKKIKKETTYGY